MADERRRERTLSYAEEERLLAACVGPRKHIKPIIVCALATGMRLGEILKLTWPQVDLESNLIRIYFTNTKTLQRRDVPITAPLLAELLALKAKALPDEPSVFGIDTNIKRGFKKACEIAKIPHGGIGGLTFHCLRHTAATRMVKQGLELSAIARIL